MAVRNLIRSIRRWYWRKKLGLAFVHNTFLVGGLSDISKDIKAGAYSYVGPGSIIGPGVTLGAYSMIGPSCKILGNDHIFDKPGEAIIFSGRPPFKATLIGKDVWIGANSIIIAGTSIGDGAIIAAGSVVTKDIPPLTVYAGIPARHLRRRFALESDDLAHLKFLALAPIEGEYCPPMSSIEPD